MYRKQFKLADSHYSLITSQPFVLAKIGVSYVTIGDVEVRSISKFRVLVNVRMK